MWESPIIRVTRGQLNRVNDAVVGGQSSIGGRSKFGGQLGKAIWLDASQIATMADPAVGALYAGGYRYVRLAAASGAIARGDLLYWDNAAELDDYQVTLAVDTTTLNYASLAGFALNTITPGNYGFVQFAGVATARYVAAITGTAATGRPVVASIATAGRVDVIDTMGADPPTQWLNRFMGWAQELPANDSVGRIEIARAFTTRL